jgi:hypothetical protein
MSSKGEQYIIPFTQRLTKIRECKLKPSFVYVMHRGALKVELLQQFPHCAAILQAAQQCSIAIIFIGADESFARTPFFFNPTTGVIPFRHAILVPVSALCVYLTALVGIYTLFALRALSAGGYARSDTTKIVLVICRGIVHVRTGYSVLVEHRWMFAFLLAE